MDSKAIFFIESLQPSTGSLQGAELKGEPGGRMGERDRPGFDGSETVKAAR